MSNKSNNIVIVAAKRTPIGSFKGSLKGLRADQLGTLVIEEVIDLVKLQKEPYKTNLGFIQHKLKS